MANAKTKIEYGLYQGAMILQQKWINKIAVNHLRICTDVPKNLHSADVLEGKKQRKTYSKKKCTNDILKVKM